MFKNPFSFAGRIRRTEYGLSAIIYTIVIVVIEYISMERIVSPTFFIMLLIPLYWFMLAQGAKRCHDRGHSGWYQLIPLYSLWLLFGVGELGENKYGPDPKDTSASSSSEIDAYAYKNFVESGDLTEDGSVKDDNIQANVNTIKEYIHEEKRAVFGSNKREVLLELIDSLCKTKEEAKIVLDVYQSSFNKDLIEELKKLNSSYSAIKENVQSFIDAGVVDPRFPHARI